MRSLRGVYENGKVRLSGRPRFRGRVPVLVTFCDEPTGNPPAKRFRSAAEHPAVGMWADREDIGDSLTFARQLRERAERRANGR